MKRIIICSDGTWNSPENEHATSVLRLANAIAPEDAQGNKQTIFYDWGVGSDGQKLAGGLSGAGIDKNIMDCYRFIVHNYDAGDSSSPGDRIFLFGFSRGAYTVRSLGGFIRNCGLLRREHAERIPEAYNLYRKRTKNSHPDSPEALAFRASYAVADRTSIEFLGAWDTVGSLGVPVPFWGTLNESKYLFHDTEPSSIIRCARHAVSIDENREDYLPTLWNEKPGLDLKQMWFAGVHSDVGGAYPARGLGDVACQWMLKEAVARGLAAETHLTSGIHPDPLDKLHNEYKGIFRLRGKVDREILPGWPIHKSVKQRWIADPKYRPKAVKRLLDAAGGNWAHLNLAD